MDIKKHIDTLVILGAFASCMLWMNAKFNSIDVKFVTLEKEFDNRFSNLEKDIAIMKTVLIMRDIYPKEMAQKEGE